MVTLYSCEVRRKQSKLLSFTGYKNSKYIYNKCKVLVQWYNYSKCLNLILVKSTSSDKFRNGYLTESQLIRIYAIASEQCGICCSTNLKT